MGDGEVRGNINLEAALEAAKRERAADPRPVLDVGNVDLSTRRERRDAEMAPDLHPAVAGALRGIPGAGPGLDAWLDSMPCATDEQIAAMERSLQREQRSERLTRSGIIEPGPLLFEDRAMILADTLEPTMALRTVQAWLASALDTRCPGHNMLILAGPRGLGKTVAAAWALAAAGGRYVTLNEYLRDYSRWHRDRSREDGSTKALARYDAPGLLVVDELRGDLERWLAEVERPGFHRLVDRRQSRRRHLTIGLTNVTGEEFRASLANGTLDERTADRMRPMARIVGLKGASLRKGSL